MFWSRWPGPHKSGVNITVSDEEGMHVDILRVGYAKNLAEAFFVLLGRKNVT